MRIFTKPLLLLVLFALSFSHNISANDGDEPNPKDLITKVSAAMGGWDKLYKLKDVQFDYYYEYQGVDQKDLSQERYIFEGEHSWASYSIHQINVMPEAEGSVIQSVVNNQPYLMHNGNMVTDKSAVGGTLFLRKANYFWFTMMYKLDNPGTVLSSAGNEVIEGINYQKVNVSYDGNQTGKKQNDTYILYINPKTNLVDQFYFSLPARGINKPVILMKVQYEKIKGVMVPAKRLIYQPNEKGQYSESPNLIQTSKNIKFKNGFEAKDFMLN